MYIRVFPGRLLKNLTWEHLYISAQLKGITVVATGDITHPDWFKEISNKLEIDSVGIPMLKEAIERMRKGRIHIAPGYDGVFGTIQIFTEDEKKRF
jgi:PHP family Zn ribbon phosphoesterase